MQNPRIPPQDVEAEKSVIGAILIDKDAIYKVGETLDSSDFYDPSHSAIFKAITALYEKGIPIDVVTLSSEMKKQKTFKNSGGTDYLTDIVTSIPTSANVEFYANIVRENSIRRKLITIGADISTKSFDTVKDIRDLLDECEKNLFSISQKNTKQDFIHIKDLLLEAYERAATSKGNEFRGIRSGFADLDGKLGGLQNSDLIIIAARPGVGKTAFMLDLATNIAVKEKKKVGFYSLEMSNDQIVDRMIAIRGSLDLFKMRVGRLSEHEEMQWSRAAEELSETDILIDDTPGQHILDLRTKARRMQLEQGLDILFVDYLQLIRGIHTDNRVLEVSEISKGLKNLARELKIPVISASQLSRSIEQRGGKRTPQLSDLRESGSIEQDADIVMFLDRPEMYVPEGEIQEEQKGIGDLVIAKHRNGPTGAIQLKWLKEGAHYGNLAHNIQA